MKLRSHNNECKSGSEGGTPAHPLPMYGIKSASCLAVLNVHMNETGLLTVLLTVYVLECQYISSLNEIVIILVWIESVRT